MSESEASSGPPETTEIPFDAAKMLAWIRELDVGDATIRDVYAAVNERERELRHSADPEPAHSIAALIAEFAANGRLEFEAEGWNEDHKPTDYAVRFDGVRLGTFPTIGEALRFLADRSKQAKAEEEAGS